MLRKMLLALGVAWTGTAAAASSELDDVTMNIVNETAFQEIISASPADIEKILAEDGANKPLRTIVLRNSDGTTTAGTPIAVSKELNQGMVSFSLICSDAKEVCEKRVQELNSANGFTLVNPADGTVGVGAGIRVTSDGNPPTSVTGLDGVPATPGALIKTGDVPSANAVRVDGTLPPAGAPGQ